MNKNSFASKTRKTFNKRERKKQEKRKKKEREKKEKRKNKTKEKNKRKNKTLLFLEENFLFSKEAQEKVTKRSAEDGTSAVSRHMFQSNNSIELL